MKIILNFIYFILMLEMGEEKPPSKAAAQFRDRYPELNYAARLRAAERRVAEDHPWVVRAADRLGRVLYGESRDGTISHMAELARVSR